MEATKTSNKEFLKEILSIAKEIDNDIDTYINGEKYEDVIKLTEDLKKAHMNIEAASVYQLHNIFDYLNEEDKEKLNDNEFMDGLRQEWGRVLFSVIKIIESNLKACLIKVEDMEVNYNQASALLEVCEKAQYKDYYNTSTESMSEEASKVQYMLSAFNLTKLSNEFDNIEMDFDVDDELDEIDETIQSNFEKFLDRAIDFANKVIDSYEI